MARGTINIDAVIKSYVGHLIAHGIEPEKIILFGSYASGNPHEWSDVDIVVISKDLEKWPPLERLEMLSVLAGSIDAPLEILGYTPDEIRKRGKDSIMWDEIQKTGKVLYAA